MDDGEEVNGILATRVLAVYVQPRDYDNMKKKKQVFSSGGDR